MVVRHDAERPLVVVPALNEEKRIEAVIDRLRRAAPDVDAIHFRYCFAYSTGGRRSADHRSKTTRVFSMVYGRTPPVNALRLIR